MATAAKREPVPVANDPADTLASAMAAAFAEFEAAGKNSNNPHFKSKYADLTAVMDAIKPALINYGLFFTQATHDSDNGVCIETVIHHRGGESYSCGRLFVPATKQDAQGFGSALTYARRYSLMTAFGIPAEDDDGNAASRSAPANDHRSAPAPIADKVPGISKIKERLRVMKTAGDAPGITLEAFRELKRINKDDLKIIRDANHGWWTGDGEDFEGFGPWIERRTTELANPTENDGMYAMLVQSLHECQTVRQLEDWTKTNAPLIENLDGAESRQFETDYAERETAIRLVDRVSA